MAVNSAWTLLTLQTYLDTVSPVFKAMLVAPGYEPQQLHFESGLDTASAYDIGVSHVTLEDVRAEINGNYEAALLCSAITFTDLTGTDVGGIVIYDEVSNLIIAVDLDEGPFTPNSSTLTYNVSELGFITLAGES